LIDVLIKFQSGAYFLTFFLWFTNSGKRAIIDKPIYFRKYNGKMGFDGEMFTKYFKGALK